MFNYFQLNCSNLVDTCNIALILFLKCEVTKCRIPPIPPLVTQCHTSSTPSPLNVWRNLWMAPYVKQQTMLLERMESHARTQEIENKKWRNFTMSNIDKLTKSTILRQDNRSLVVSGVRYSPRDHGFRVQTTLRSMHFFRDFKLWVPSLRFQARQKSEA